VISFQWRSSSQSPGDFSGFLLWRLPASDLRLYQRVGLDTVEKNTRLTRPTPRTTPGDYLVLPYTRLPTVMAK